jgi:hypothetical protein
LSIVSIIIWERKKIPVVVISYLAFYVLLMFNWPFYDPRFWVPIVPLCIAILSKTSISLPRFWKITVQSLKLFYIILGFASVVYLTYTSFNKQVFSATQAGGSYRNEYETFFFGKPQSENTIPVDSVIVRLLKECN